MSNQMIISNQEPKNPSQKQIIDEVVLPENRSQKSIGQEMAVPGQKQPQQLEKNPQLQPIKILSFRQFRIPEVPETPFIARGDYILNCIIYSPNKELAFLDRSLQELNKKDKIFVAKCYNTTSFSYALKNCKIGIKTIIISDQKMDQNLINIIFKNQQLLGNSSKVKVWLFVPIVERSPHNYFHEQRMQLICCDKSKMIKLLEDNAKTAEQISLQCLSNSTIQSADQDLMRRKLDINQDQQRQFIGTPRQMKHLIQDNGVPGVGTYNLDYGKFGSPPGQSAFFERSRRNFVFPPQQHKKPQQVSVTQTKKL